jgi:hypothetical protein
MGLKMKVGYSPRKAQGTKAEQAERWLGLFCLPDRAAWGYLQLTLLSLPSVTELSHDTFPLPFILIP